MWPKYCIEIIRKYKYILLQMIAKLIFGSPLKNICTIVHATVCISPYMTIENLYSPFANLAQTKHRIHSVCYLVRNISQSVELPKRDVGLPHI